MDILSKRFLGTITTTVSTHYLGTVIDVELMKQKPTESAVVLQETFEPSEKQNWVEKVQSQYGDALFLADATPK